MRDDELRRRFQSLEGDHEPDPAFHDELFARLSAEAGERRRASTRPMLLLAAVLALGGLAAGAAVGSGLLERDIASDATPLPAPSASAPVAVASPFEEPAKTPAPSTPASMEVLDPTPPAIAVGQAVETTVVDLTVRAQPGTGSEALGLLDLGTRAVVIGGPVDADGLPWFHLTAPGLPYESGCAADPPGRLQCPTWAGWVAGENAEGDRWLAAVELSNVCPAESSLQPFPRGLTRLQPAYRVVCYGNEELRLVGYYPPIPEGAGLGGACLAEHEPWGWLSCQNINYNGLDYSDPPSSAGMLGAFFVSIDPRSGITMPERGQWVEVTGHFDDPASQGCADAQANVTEAEESVFFCRQQFAVTAVRVVPAP